MSVVLVVCFFCNYRMCVCVDGVSVLTASVSRRHEPWERPLRSHPVTRPILRIVNTTYGLSAVIYKTVRWDAGRRSLVSSSSRSEEKGGEGGGGRRCMKPCVCISLMLFSLFFSRPMLWVCFVCVYVHVEYDALVWLWTCFKVEIK